MQRFIAKRVLSGRDQFPRWQRWFSHAVQKEATSLNDNGVDVVVPKIPPFDYSPPPYDGPSADEILAKRKEYLSPSMFYFYKKPVSFCVFASLSIIGSTDFVLIHFISFWFFFLPVFIFFDVSFWLFVCRFFFFDGVIGLNHVYVAERGGWEDAILVRREWEEIFGCVWRDCYGVLRALPPWCGRGHRQPNQPLTTLHHPLSQPSYRWFRRGPRLQVAWKS